MNDRFAQERRFEQALEQRGTRGRAASGWLTISAPAGTEAGAGAGSPGRPGLWRPCRGEGGAPTASFSVPMWVFEQIDDEHGDGDVEPLLQPVIEWALETLEGRLPEGWSAPGPETMDELVPAAERSVRFGGFMAPLAVHADADGEPHAGALRLAVPVARLDDAIAAERRRWLEVALDQASSRTMARLAVIDGVVEAEVDLRGAPAPVLAPIVRAAVESLQESYRRLVVPATVIGGTCVSRALGQSPEAWHAVFQPASDSSKRSSTS